MAAKMHKKPSGALIMPATLWAAAGVADEKVDGTGASVVLSCIWPADGRSALMAPASNKTKTAARTGARRTFVFKVFSQVSVYILTEDAVVYLMVFFLLDVLKFRTL